MLDLKCFIIFVEKKIQSSNKNTQYTQLFLSKSNHLNLNNEIQSWLMCMRDLDYIEAVVWSQLEGTNFTEFVDIVFHIMVNVIFSDDTF